MRCALSRRAAPYPFDDEQRAASRYRDRALPLALVPPRGPEAHWLAGPDGNQDAVDQQIGPAEPGVPPGDVVGMHDGRPRDRVPQPRGQCGLAAGAAPVHGQHDRTVTGAPGLAELQQDGGDIGDQFSMPPPGFGLVWG